MTRIVSSATLKSTCPDRVVCGRRRFYNSRYLQSCRIFKYYSLVSIKCIHNNSPVTMITNYDDVEPTTRVKRWSSSANCKIDVPQPALFKNYNKSMDKHYIVQDWPLRENLIPGQKNVAHNPLVPKENIYLPPLHIKLGLIKQFVKAVDKPGGAFQFLKTKFPHLSEAKIKEGVFVGPQIRQLFQDSTFIEHLNRKEKRALLAKRL
ncbi:hypothetical protein RN001_006654 [Aquatica leii]|uniref:Uncharacterized protein n=1 Tax=Aquatica leii TaxID=1421715 RepID=A0AAN7SSA5_9COLE|nr:hypothetical protein RN001_006654 [Aquatica leii]